MAAVVVFAPQERGAPAAVALELASIARELAGEVIAFSFGEGAAQSATTLGEYGVGRLVVVEVPEDGLAPVHVAAAIEAHIGQEAPEALLFPATYDGRDIAAQLSAVLDRPVLANVIALARNGDEIVTEHALFGGSEIATAKLTGEAPGIYLVRAKSIEAQPTGGAPAVVETQAVGELGEAGRPKVLARHVEARLGPALEEANVVVSGGRGLGAAERYELIERLAGLLRGAAGASRAVVDAGWAPYQRQVGQTGKTVKPEVYLAFGISGATQHLVGMKGSRHILAVNRDADAPIFSVAELGVIGDVTELLPKLIAALEGRA